MPRFPDFQKLWDAYPNDKDPAVVKQQIGGGVDAPWIGNTCAIRMSRAFNYAGDGWRIPAAHRYADQNAEPRVMNTVKGGDGLRYAYRVAELLKWLRETFGPPQLRLRKKRGDGMPAAFAGRRGIVVFNDCGWDDATGHVDLWNKDRAGLHAYWEPAREVYLWSDEARWAITGAQEQGGAPVVTIGRR